MVRTGEAGPQAYAGLSHRRPFVLGKSEGMMCVRTPVRRPNAQSGTYG